MQKLILYMNLMESSGNMNLMQRSGKKKLKRRGRGNVFMSGEDLYLEINTLPNIIGISHELKNYNNNYSDFG